MFRLSFRPRFYISRNYSRIEVEIKHLRTLRPVLCIEFRYGSRHDSHLGWRRDICKILSENAQNGVIRHFEDVHISKSRILKISRAHSWGPGSRGPAQRPNLGARAHAWAHIQANEYDESR